MFLGNSITDMGSWSEIFQNPNIKNRGISGDVTEGILYRINEITESQPLQVFLMIGTNDLAQGLTKELTFQNICKIVKSIQSQSSKTEIIVQSIL
ncbi:MAG: GDSL-type esterase/lipase family protein, partial [Fidelibacterota bacterium]